MDRATLIAQLAVLKSTYANTGESIDKLISHFQAALDNREVVYIEEEGEVVAFCDFSWIHSPEDIEKVSRGERTEGTILHVINLVCRKPGLIWKIRKMLPFHVHISGERRGKLHTPKGIPDLAEVY